MLRILKHPLFAIDSPNNLGITIFINVSENIIKISTFQRFLSKPSIVFQEFVYDCIGFVCSLKESVLKACNALDPNAGFDFLELHFIARSTFLLVYELFTIESPTIISKFVRQFCNLLSPCSPTTIALQDSFAFRCACRLCYAYFLPNAFMFSTTHKSDKQNQCDDKNVLSHYLPL